MNGLVSHLHMQCLLISVRINSDRLDPHFLGCFDHAASNFATICNQDLFKHGLSPLRSVFGAAQYALQNA